MLSRRRIGARAKGRKKKKKTTVPLYLMMAPLESSASFRASEALQRFTKIKNRKRREKERKRKKRKNNEKEEKKKKQQRYSNCMLRAACDCVSVFLFFFFFWKGRQNEHTFAMVSLTNLGSKDRASFQRFFFFSSFHFRSIYFI